MKVIEADRTANLVKLRHSYSATSIKYLESFETPQVVTPVQKRRSIDALKSTLDDLELKIKNAKIEL